MIDARGPEVPIFARAILVTHQGDAVPFLDLRIARMVEDGQVDDADYWSAVKLEAQRQIDTGIWHAAG